MQCSAKAGSRDNCWVFLHLLNAPLRNCGDPAFLPPMFWTDFQCLFQSSDQILAFFLQQLKGILTTLVGEMNAGAVLDLSVLQWTCFPTTKVLERAFLPVKWSNLVGFGGIMWERKFDDGGRKDERRAAFALSLLLLSAATKVLERVGAAVAQGTHTRHRPNQGQ